MSSSSSSRSSKLASSSRWAGAGARPSRLPSTLAPGSPCPAAVAALYLIVHRFS
ncbi:hypothetical protein H2136_24115 [Aeromonas hydrophila]|uniref:Uncharacterized protein n=1 Tax=Aeromonas hydrophila TaxID=644 RepID=A0A926FM24_AERHY|nr:hypothetical protein [Aeromonas hydrophila]